MLRILQIGLFFVFLTIFPFIPGSLLILPGSGTLPEEESGSGKKPIRPGFIAGTGRAGAYTLPAMWCVGWIVMFASFYWPAVLCVLFHRSLNELTVIWLVITALLIIAAAFRLKNPEYNPKKLIDRYIHGITFPEIIASAAVLGHAVVTAVFMHIDNDDYAYVANATTALDTNTLLKYIGGTGKEVVTYGADGIDRLVSSPQFAFYAVVSKLFGTRPAALCHTYLPPFFTCMFFICFFMVGYRLFRGNRQKTGVFAAFIFLVNISSYYSTYTAGTFMMVRSWQGKAQIVGMVLPLIFWLYLGILQNGSMSPGETVFLAALLEAACLMTSMGAVLSAGSAFVLALITAIIAKNRKIVLLTLPPLILPLVTAAIYLKVS